MPFQNLTPHAGWIIMLISGAVGYTIGRVRPLRGFRFGPRRSQLVESAGILANQKPAER